MFSQSRFQPDRFFRPAVSLGITDWCLEDQVDCWLLFSSSLAFFFLFFLLNLRLRGCLFLAWNTSIIIGGIAIKFCSYGSQRMNPTDLITDSKKKKKKKKRKSRTRTFCSVPAVGMAANSCQNAIFTFAKEVIFSPVSKFFVSWLVGLSAGLHTNCWTDFPWNLGIGWVFSPE